MKHISNRKTIFSLLCALALLLICSCQSHIVLADPEPEWDITKGFAKVAQDSPIVVTVGGEVGETNGAGKFLVPPALLRALLNAADTRPSPLK